MKDKHEGITITGGNVQIGAAAAGKNSRASVEKVKFASSEDSAFQRPEDKTQFLNTLDELSSVLNQLKSEIESAGALKNGLEQVPREIAKNLQEIERAKKVTSEVDPGQKTPESVKSTVESTLNSVEKRLHTLKSIMDIGSDIGHTAVILGEKIGPFILSASSLAISAARLFGLQ